MTDTENNIVVSTDKIELMLSSAVQYQTQNMHELAISFVETIPNITNDENFINRANSILSISGYYSKLSDRKLAGKTVSENIALNRKIPWHDRDAARKNSTWYASSLTDLCPSTTLHKIAFLPKYNYNSLNPSVYSFNDKLWMIQRTVNYRVTADGSYDMRGDNAIRTINYLISLNDDLSVATAEEILPPDNLSDPLYSLVVGWEDCRLFFWKGEPWCTATVRELNHEGWCEIVLSKIVDAGNGKRKFAEHRMISPKFCDKQHEKNWMPMVVNDSLFFIYSSDPVRIIDSDGNLVSSRVSHIASDSFRGGGAAIPVNNGWLAMIHESHNMSYGKRRYMHRFVWYDSFGRLAKYSEAFYIKELGIEFSAGLAKHPKTGQIIVSFGVDDFSSYLAVLSLEDINKMLKNAGPVFEKLPSDYKVLNWLISQTNNVLADYASIETCKAILKTADLPIDNFNAMNWFNVLAIWILSFTDDSRASIMHITDTVDRSYMTCLKHLGYTNVVEVQTNTQTAELVNNLANFKDSSYSFISCNNLLTQTGGIDKILLELSRVLEIGGHLFVGENFWQGAHGSPEYNLKNVFGINDIVNLIAAAKKYNLEPTTNVHFNCSEKTVNNESTVINILFKKSK